MRESKSGKKRQFNALKHGAFATELFILNEDEHEFQDLHKGLIEELKPSGRMEEELVLEMAKLHWRKRRIERFYASEANWIRADQAGEEDLEWTAMVNRMIVKGMPCHAVWTRLVAQLPPLFREEVEREFQRPSENYDDEWIERLKLFIRGRLLLADSAIQDKQKSVRFIGETAAKLTELSAKRMVLEERIDAALDRAFRRYAQLKTFKEVMAVKNGGAPPKISTR